MIYRFIGKAISYNNKYCYVDIETIAVSYSKAKSNISYQAKKRLGLAPGAYVKLIGEIIDEYNQLIERLR